MRIITWEDLSDSGVMIQTLFAAAFPDGLTEDEMANSEHGWVRRAYARWKEAHPDG